MVPQGALVKIRRYEGGIPYLEEIPDPPPGFMRWVDTLPCTCNGEAHDECNPNNRDEE